MEEKRAMVKQIIIKGDTAMVKFPKTIVVFTLLIVLALLVTSCGAAAPAPPGEAEQKPATQEPATTEEAVVEQPATTEPTEAAAPATEEAAVPATEEAASAAGFTLAPRIAEKVANGEDLVIRVSYHDVSNEFAPFIKKGTEKAAADFGVDAVMVGPTGPDADAQIAELESLVEAGADGLAVSSVSTDALAPVINRLLEQGIPVVTYNTDNPDSNRLAFAGQDLIQSGYEAAKVLTELLGGKGEVIITTLDAAAQWSIDRETGAKNGFAEYPDIKVIQTINTGTEPQEIYAAIENAMLANPNVTGILSLECCSTPSAGEYVKRNNLQGEITVVGFDELPQTLDLVKEGMVAATLSQAPERQSYEAVRMLLDVINGKAVEDVDTGIAVIDAKNVEEYMSAQ
jgi:simple sugar transport system substrate-binding protein